MSVYIIPAVLMLILVFSFGKTEVYNSFIKGVGEGLETVVGIFPAILAILSVSAMLEASGAFAFLIRLIAPVAEKIGIPNDIMPLALMRPVSGGASLGILTDMLKKFSPDSYNGRVASVIMGATETTFYTLCVYFRKTRVKYTKKIIPAAVIGDIVGLIAAVWVCRIIF